MSKQPEQQPDFDRDNGADSSEPVRVRGDMRVPAPRQDRPDATVPADPSGLLPPTSDETEAEALDPEAGGDRSQLEDVASDSPDEERVAQMLSHSLDIDVFVPAVQTLEAPDAADALEELATDEAADVVFKMDDQVSARDIAEMQRPIAVMVLEDLAEDYGPQEPARYLGLMDPDVAVDILQECPEDFRERILDALPPTRAVLLESLLRYEPETAGGLMTTNCVKVNSESTIGDAVEAIRNQEDTDLLFVFCVDDEQRLAGMLSPRELLVNNPDSLVKDVMRRQVDYLRPDLDREDVAEAFDRYDYTVMPVVDRAQRLLGVVTVDDVLDIIREEQTEDAYKMVGAGMGEAVYSGLWLKMRGRFPWLIVNLFTSLLAALVVLKFEDLISNVALLAVMMPVIANQAGNAGQQSLAVTLRGLVLNEVRQARVWPLIWRELALGLLTGAVVGTLVCTAIILFGLTGLWPSASWRLGLIALFAMSTSLGVGCLTGTVMPLVMDRLKRDPATASTIFLTMVTDSVSFFTFLGSAKIFEHLLLATTSGA